MPEANLTKRALAHAFKELLQKQPFDKVGVSDICDACGVSRKTFYYHFQDKYALAEWVFDTEIIAPLQKADTADRWALIDAICRYLYQSRAFYAHLMQYDGQNTFRRHFQEFLFRAVEKYLLPAPGEIDAVAACDGIPAQTARDFYAHFLADAVLVAVFHWLGEGAKLPPEQFVALLHITEGLIHIQSNQLEQEKAGRATES